MLRKQRDAKQGSQEAILMRKTLFDSTNDALLDSIDDALDVHIPLAAARFPGDPHVATRHRWRLRGVKHGDRVIRLKSIVCGARVYTTQRWANEFIAECNAARGTSLPDDAAAAAAERRAAEAGKALEALGC